MGLHGIKLGTVTPIRARLGAPGGFDLIPWRNNLTPCFAFWSPVRGGNAHPPISWRNCTAVTVGRHAVTHRDVTPVTLRSFRGATLLSSSREDEVGRSANVIERGACPGCQLGGMMQFLAKVHHA